MMQFDRLYGQTRSLDFDPLPDTVDRYIEENSPYGPFKPLRINLRKYLQYVEEYHINDPSTIPDTFILPEKPRSVAQ